MIRGATLFSGGRGVECLLRDLIDFQFAVEYDPKIAAIGAQLGGNSIVGDVCTVDYTAWGALDYLHASPVCKNASAAKTNGAESDNDIATAQAVIRCLEATQPRVFTLENVQGYTHFRAYRLICQALDTLGYFWHAEVLNAANYGVPQTRRRLILRAVQGALLPSLPEPETWMGWYAAIEDLIPTLPDSQFAPWQVALLPVELRDSFLPSAVNADGTTVPRTSAEPSFTVQATSGKQMPRAFIVHANDMRTMPIRDETRRNRCLRLSRVATHHTHQTPDRALG